MDTTMVVHRRAMAHGGHSDLDHCHGNRQCKLVTTGVMCIADAFAFAFAFAPALLYLLSGRAEPPRSLPTPETPLTCPARKSRLPSRLDSAAW